MQTILNILLQFLSIQLFWVCSLFIQFDFSTDASAFNMNPVKGTAQQLTGDVTNKEKKDVIVSLEPSVAPIINSFASKTIVNRQGHVTSMVTSLQMLSTQSHAPVLKELNGFGAHAQSFWLTNQIFVKGASPLMIETIRSIPSVKGVEESILLPFIPIVEKVVGRQPNGTEWNVKKVLAEKVWKKGVKGKGIVVASIDTGVRGTHPAIKKNYVGNIKHGWYDPLFGTENPVDVVGHGTHTVGTMVGRDGIGIAPKAKWMACIGCTTSYCAQPELLACGQYMLCPSNPKLVGKEYNCTNIPHIINNSWGDPTRQSFYDIVIDAWKAAGILAVFANGNDGPRCETASRPGDHGYPIVVGATDNVDRLARFSSRGPKVIKNKNGSVVGGMFDMVVKIRDKTIDLSPEICAPGHLVNSAGHLSDMSYQVLSGTSMASPLVTGAVALLLSVNPKLTQQEMKQLLITTTEQDLPPTNTEQCGSEAETKFPNNMYGYGRMNIYEAYKKLMEMMKESEPDKEFSKEEEKGEDELSKEEDVDE